MANYEDDPRYEKTGENEYFDTVTEETVFVLSMEERQAVARQVAERLDGQSRVEEPANAERDAGTPVMDNDAKSPKRSSPTLIQNFSETPQDGASAQRVNGLKARKKEKHTTSESKPSTENEEVEFKHIVNATCLIISSANESHLVKQWVQSHDLTCAICVAYHKGYISDITPIGEEAIRKSFSVMADAIKVSTGRLVDIAYDIDEEFEL